ncbi:MAG: thiol:disulfide interchange protein [Pedosphaera sp.]|nr:thiol:disulfide interchange protein [Pedosphaera sp.]
MQSYRAIAQWGDLPYISWEMDTERNSFKFFHSSGINTYVRTLMAFLGLIFFSLVPADSAFATTTKVRLMLSGEAAKPGDTVTAAISLEMQPHWHSYWKNPGDSGIATRIEWTLPPGVTTGEIQWPIPEKLVTPPLTTYVHSDETVLLVPLKIDSTVAPGPLEIKAKVSWQECADVCIQGRTNLSTRITVGADSKPSADVAFIEAARKKLPQIDPNTLAQAHWENDEETRSAIIEWKVAGSPAQVDFFPYSNDKYEVKGETERLADEGGKVRIRKQVSKTGPDWPTQLNGLLVSRATTNEGYQGTEVAINLSPAKVAAVEAQSSQTTSLVLMLGFAFLGGLILNIMPCVLPVIALKVLGIVNQAKEAPARVRKLGLVYGLGVWVSFLVLAGLAIAVQQAGHLASWSSAFQNPQFRVIITILITLVALNLFGLFEITLSGRAMGAAGELTAKEGTAGAFFNGVLATVLATPCTAPFLGVAIGFAFTQPPAVIFLIFTAVAFGLAAPFVLLCWNPAWLKFLPRPGLWMQRFKVAMGFPMLATAVWLFWLTATRLGKSGVLWLGLFLVILSLAVWIWGEFVQRGTKRAGLAIVVSLLLITGGYVLILENQLHWRSPLTAQKEGIVWEAWSPEVLQKARGEGRPVLVDFTADTCLNCQVNKATSIDIKSTRAKLKEINAVTLIGDFTDENETIARELKRFGRSAIPLVLVYPANKNLPPIVLPPILTPGIVSDALDKAAKTNQLQVTAQDRTSK